MPRGHQISDLLVRCHNQKSGATLRLLATFTVCRLRKKARTPLARTLTVFVAFSNFILLIFFGMYSDRHRENRGWRFTEFLSFYFIHAALFLLVIFVLFGNGFFFFFSAVGTQGFIGLDTILYRSSCLFWFFCGLLRGSGVIFGWGQWT